MFGNVDTVGELIAEDEMSEDDRDRVLTDDLPEMDAVVAMGANRFER